MCVTSKIKIRIGDKMPQKSTAPRRTTKSSSGSKKQSWFRKLVSRKYAKPVAFIAAFMLIGGTTLYFVSAATTSYSLWSDSAVPKTVAVTDSKATQVGLKFKSSVAGYVTGVRFYKSAQNSGTHTGNLWDNNGKLLATATFTNETSNGWQTASFTTPVNIAANVTYVISYYAPAGHYSLNANYFKTSSRTKNNLTAPRNTATNPNGVYAYSTIPNTFPTTGGNGANYWVDVVFNTKLVNPQPAPAAPGGLAANTQANGSVVLNWQASVSANTITDYTVYRDGSKLVSVGNALTYLDSTTQAGHTYSYQVQATDNTGRSSVLSAAVSVTLPSGGTTGGGSSTPGACALPKYPSPACTGVPAGTALSKTITGDYNVTAAGEVIDGWHITGSLNIHANNVVVKNSQIDGTVNNEGTTNVYYPFTIADSTVGPSSGCVGSPGVGEGSYTATRIYVRGHDDGFRMSGNNVTVQDSYFNACWLPPALAPPDGSHSDGFQAYCPAAACANLQLLHNTLDLSGVPATFPLNMVDTNLSAVTANDNLLLGGHNYLIVSFWHSGPNWTLHNNRLVKDTWDSAGPYPNLNFAASAEGTCSHQDWQGNTIVTIDSSYNVTSTLTGTGCID
jgi:hypothetical protein